MANDAASQVALATLILGVVVGTLVAVTASIWLVVLALAGVQKLAEML